MIGFSGVDGSGKTTIAKLVVEKLRLLGFEVIYHHELDISKILVFIVNGLLGHKRTERLKIDLFLRTNLIVKDKNRFPYLGWYYFIMWLEKMMIYFYFKLKRGIIVSDRWPNDFLIHFYQTQYSNWVVNKLFTIYPKPDIWVFLFVQSNIAHQRKKHEEGHRLHKVEYYQTLQSYFFNVTNNFKYSVMIDSSKPIDEVLNDVLSTIKHINQKPKRLKNTGV